MWQMWFPRFECCRAVLVVNCRATMNPEPKKRAGRSPGRYRYVGQIATPSKVEDPETGSVANTAMVG